MRNTKFNFQTNVKKGLLYVVTTMLSVLMFSCDKDDNNGGVAPLAQSPAGVADITLTAGGQEYKINGPCGWAVAAGMKYIGANQADNNLKTFSSYFNIDALPTVTTTYTLVEDSSDTDSTHITMHITEISGNVLTAWNSKTTSGILTLVVEGNKVTANLAGITLYPETNPGVFTSGNVGAFANNGAMTGTLTFYKN